MGGWRGGRWSGVPGGTRDHCPPTTTPTDAKEWTHVPDRGSTFLLLPFFPGTLPLFPDSHPALSSDKGPLTIWDPRGATARVGSTAAPRRALPQPGGVVGSV